MFLDNAIKPYISKQYILNFTQDFINKPKEFTPSRNQIIVSFDVFSLFINVLLNETIEIVTKYVFA